LSVVVEEEKEEEEEEEEEAPVQYDMSFKSSFHRTRKPKSLFAHIFAGGILRGGEKT